MGSEKGHHPLVLDFVISAACIDRVYIYMVQYRNSVPEADRWAIKQEYVTPCTGDHRTLHLRGLLIHTLNARTRDLPIENFAIGFVFAASMCTMPHTT